MWVLPDCLQDIFRRMPACCIVIYRTMKFYVVYLHILEACVCHNLTSQRKIPYFNPYFLFFILAPIFFFCIVSLFLSYSLHTLFSSFLFLFLPVSRYDFLLPFFLCFSLSSLSLLYLHFSYFCSFSLLMSV